MTVSPLSGFFGPQAVNTVVRGVVVIVDTNKKRKLELHLLIAVDLGLVGPQAVSVVNRRDALHH
jgi:hypothetical protein